MKPLRPSILVIVCLCYQTFETKAQWTQVNTGLTNSNILSLAVSGTNLFAGTWGSGVFLSMNNGTSWTAVNSGLTNSSVTSFAVSGTNLFAGTQGGVFLSTNSGASWTQAGMTSSNIVSLAVSGTNLFAGTQWGGVFLSTNNGAIWTAVNMGLTRYNGILLAVSGTNLFAGSDSGGVFLSSNNGTSWINAGFTTTPVYAIAVSGANLFVGTQGGVFLSTNNGMSWAKTGSLAASAFAVSGTKLFAGTYSDVFLSSDNGTSWVSTGLTTTGVHALAVSGENLFVGTQGGGVFRRSLSDWMTPLTPANGFGGITPPATFKWKTNSQALAYSFQISTDGSFLNLVVNQYTTDTTYTVSNLQLATVYYWRVRAENATWASEWGSGSFTTKLTTAPQLSSPSSGATLVSVTPTLSWNPIVSTASYTLQVSTRLAFDTQIFAIDTTTTSVVLSQLQRSTTYYWRVRAKTVGDTTAWSSVSSFTTLPNAPNKITLVYPDSSKQDAYQNDWLTWQGDNIATTYLIHISQSPLFISIPFDSATVKIAGYRNANKVFTSGSTYFWRVRGTNVAGDGPFSSVWSFKVGNALRVAVTSYSASTFAFGEVKLGQYTDTTVTISNTGNDTLKITNISSSNAAFSVRPTNKNVPPGQSFVDTIRFVPTTIGVGTSSVIISSNSSTGLDTIKVSGFGYGQGVASINVANVVLANTRIGQYGDTTVTINNTGNDTLKIASVISSNPVFSVRTSSRMLSPTQNLVDTIRYTPTAIGAANASIVVISNSPTSPDTIKVSGLGYGQSVLSLSASAISFGNVKVGQIKDTVVTISNNGNDTLKISSISSSVSAFSARPTVRNTPLGQSFADTIRYTPSVIGTTSGRILIASNAATSPDTVYVSGTGVGVSISGAVRYGNSGGSPIRGVNITLAPLPSGNQTVSASDSSGAYLFTAVLPGNYSLTANKLGEFPAAYVNAADALKAALFFIDSTTHPLTLAQRSAADVNGDGTINSGDALQIVLRYVERLTSFLKGDWVFAPASSNISVGNQNVTDDVIGLAVGDVNGDAQPDGSYFAKANRTLFVVAEAAPALKVSMNDMFEIPVRVKAATSIGSMSMAFQYPTESATFLGVRGPEGMVSSANDGVLAVAWFNAEHALNLKDNDAIITLRFKPTSRIKDFSLTLDRNGQVTDAEGTVLSGITLEIPAVDAAMPTVFTLAQNYPNPFNPSTTIQYDLPALAHVVLAVYNTLGQTVLKLIDEQQNAGTYKVRWDGSGVASGMYFYRLQAGEFIDTKRMILLK